MTNHPQPRYKIGDRLFLEGGGTAIIISIDNVSLFRQEYEMIMGKQVITAIVESFDREARVHKVGYSNLAKVLYENQNK